eukprot:TRINITY_DN7779_c0_g1_i1.p1 TRINITY_DN7779_c0_g1~~TRINITY_DN7779_c0_g1_i1.p1  ORF type:complete len:812 (+),score=106.56 TRINITY_DN7779_c0_g1_i1:58-2493(+)
MMFSRIILSSISLILIFSSCLGQQRQCQSPGINTNKILTIPDQHIQDIVWSSDLKVAWILTFDYLYQLRDNGSLTLVALEGSEQPGGQVERIIQTSSPNLFYFVSLRQKYMWYTVDNGDTYTRVDLPYRILTIFPHPTDSNRLLVQMPRTDGVVELRNSNNRGVSWTIVSSTIVLAQSNIAWGYEPEMVFVLYTSYGIDLLLISKDFFHTAEKVLPYVKNFKYYKDVGEKGLLLVEMAPGNLAYSDNVISYDGGEIFIPVNISALFLPDFQNKTEHADITSATVAPDGTIMWIHVTDVSADNFSNKTQYFSNLLVSSVFSGSFSFSLANCIRVDKVSGLEGVWLAEVKDSTAPGPWNRITFDNGVSWFPIMATDPADTTLCDNSTHCYLSFKPLPNRLSVSRDDTPGFFLVLGGPDETNSQNVYLTRTGGKDFEKLTDGPYLFNFTNNGNFIVLVSTNLTKTIRYSTDKGLQWSECEFTDKPIIPISILAFPHDNSRFWLFAQNVTEINVYVIDFRSIGLPTCSPYSPILPGLSQGPYEIFSLDNCTFGRRVMYPRLSPTANCTLPVSDDLFNNRNIMNCTCDDQDWTCDYCFSKTSSGCTLVCPLRPDTPPRCNDTFETNNLGFRKIFGNTCFNGTIHPSGGEIPCPTIAEVFYFKYGFFSDPSKNEEYLPPFKNFTLLCPFFLADGKGIRSLNYQKGSFHYYEDKRSTKVDDTTVWVLELVNPQLMGICFYFTREDFSFNLVVQPGNLVYNLRTIPDVVPTIPPFHKAAHSKRLAAIIVPIVVGGVVIIGIVILFVVFYRRRSKSPSMA